MTFRTRLSSIASRLIDWRAGLGLFLLIALHLFDAIPYQDKLRTFSFDIYQMTIPRERISSPVLIVDIDEDSLQRFGQWPWPRSLMAQLLDRVWQMAPAAVGFDIIMPEPDRSSPCQSTKYIPGIDPALVQQVCALPSNDSLLASSLRRGPAVLGVAGMDGHLSGRLIFTPVRMLGEEPLGKIRQFDSALTNVAELDEAAAGHAILSADIERGVVRRLPLIAAVGNTVMPSLSLEMLRLVSGSASFSVKSAKNRVEGVGVGDLFIPTQADGSMWVHYSPHEPARFVSAASVLDGKLPPSLFERKLILVGFSGLGLVDFPSTALGERVPGVEIHAQLLESIFDGTTLHRPYWAVWAEGGLMLLLGLTIIRIFPHIKAGVLVPIVLVVVALLATAGLAAYARYQLLLDMASPTLLFLMMFVAMLADSLILEELQLKALEDDLRQQREQAAKAMGEMEAAKRFQMGMLPDVRAVFASENRLDIAAMMEPAKMVGGDLYDCFMLDEHRVIFSVGDVCGKGVPASLFMVVCKTLCKSVALRQDLHDFDLGLLIEQANREISRDNPEMLFVTAFVGLLDLRSGELIYCNAGHEAPLLAAHGCHPRELGGASGPPISIIDDCEYQTFRYRLSSQEFLCLFTDGATEAFNLAQQEYGKDRLKDALGDISREADANAVMECIRDSVHVFAAGAEPSDDLTMMVLRWHDRPPA